MNDTPNTSDADHESPSWSVSPFQAGLKGVCPKCGKGKLFNGLLSLHESCDHCGFDLSSADPADGPAVFVMFIVGTMIVMLALWMEFKLGVPVWVHLIIVPLVTVLLSLWMLRFMKAWMVAMQFQNDAREGALDRSESEAGDD